MFSPSYFLISIRYLQASKKNATIATMMTICFCGIFIGTLSLALIISIMKGFEQATHKKMQSIYPQIIIDAHGQDLNYQQMIPILQDPVYGVQAYAPQQKAQILCYNPHTQEMPYVIQLKGIDPKLEQNVTALHTMLLPKNQTHQLPVLLHHNQVIIGKQLALQLQASTGSILTIMYSQDDDLTKKIEFQEIDVIVSGIFDTGIDEFDTNFMYASHNFFQQILPNKGICEVYLQSIHKHDESKSIKLLQERLQIHVFSWKKLYASLVAALELEKYAMFLILLLIILVASSNIISLLFMQITQKKRDIALLLLFGLSLRNVKKLFLFFTMIITTCGSFFGLLCAYLVGLGIERYHWIKLPDNVYYATHLPIELDPNLFLFIFFVVLTISFCASLIPLHKIKMKNIVTILKNEL